jgi:hypothetical protein
LTKLSLAMVLTDLNPAKFLTDQDWPCDLRRSRWLIPVCVRTRLKYRSVIYRLGRHRADNFLRGLIILSGTKKCSTCMWRKMNPSFFVFATLQTIDKISGNTPIHRIAKIN